MLGLWRALGFSDSGLLCDSAEAVESCQVIDCISGGKVHARALHAGMPEDCREASIGKVSIQAFVPFGKKLYQS